jgi:hypothetical protein
VAEIARARYRGLTALAGCVSERGVWRAEEFPDRDTLVVELVRQSEPLLQLRAKLVLEEVDDGLAITIEFKDVPVGEYELSLFNLGSWHWEPRSS